MLFIFVLFWVLIGFGIYLEELSNEHAAILAAIWVLAFILLKQSAVDFWVLWLGGITAALDIFLILKIFKQDIRIPPGSGGLTV